MFNQIPTHSFYIFNKQIVFISNNSFKQRQEVAKDIRKYVNENIKFDNITTIGGEAYIFGLTNNNVKNIINYTNSKSIYNDVDFNNTFYGKIKENNLIDYNKCNEIKTSDLLIINLAKLNQNLMKIINSNDYKEIIIINCHHDDFWKKIKLLDRYKLISRKHFITSKTNLKDSQECSATHMFITVNIFIKIPPTFISLGGNCAIAYQLKKLGLRNKSYPFDWCKISISKLNKVLENDFENFSDIEITKYSKNHLLDGQDDSDEEINSGSYIVKNKYNISFAHEIKTDTEEEIKEFKITLKRRIQRFKNLNNHNITFVILNLENVKNKKNININLEFLLKNLKIYFKHFKLIYIGYNEIKEKFLHKEIKYIKINTNDWVDWQYSNLDWNHIFI
jgi:hypothetical protein